MLLDETKYKDGLTPWHRLLILYLVQKHNIIFRLIGVDYINEDDIREVGIWTISKVRDSLSYIGQDNNDAVNCPWCRHHNTSIQRRNHECPDCGYGIRHGKCNRSSSEKCSSNYKRILHEFYSKNLIDHNKINVRGRRAGVVYKAGISTNPELIGLSVTIRSYYETLSK